MSRTRPPGGLTGRGIPRGLLAGGAAMLVGGILGWLAWGAAGLVMLGLGALVIVAPVVDRLTSNRRPLSTSDVDYAHVIYDESLDYRRISLTRDSVFSIGAPRTIMNTIHLKSGWGHFVGASTELSEFGLDTFIHEICHAWQYQNGGLAYIPKSLWAQLVAYLTRHTRDAAYDWRSALAGGIPWERWNPEQQAESMADYNRALRRSSGSEKTPSDADTLAQVSPFVEKVRQRVGAPRFASQPGR